MGPCGQPEVGVRGSWGPGEGLVGQGGQQPGPLTLGAPMAHAAEARPLGRRQLITLKRVDRRGPTGSKWPKEQFCDLEYVEVKNSMEHSDLFCERPTEGRSFSSVFRIR